jgi:hypothetical protein
LLNQPREDQPIVPPLFEPNHQKAHLVITEALHDHITINPLTSQGQQLGLAIIIIIIITTTTTTNHLISLGQRQS